MNHTAPRHATDSAFLRFTPEELQIRTAAAEFLGGVLPLQRLHAAGSADLSAEIRRQIGTLGWFSLSLPESSGGYGLSSVEHALFFRESGRECGPIDLLTQSLAILTAADDPDLQTAFASGAESVMLAVRDQQGFRLLGAPAAHLALCVDRDRAALFDVFNAQITARPALDPSTSMGVLAALPDTAVVRASGAAIWSMGQLGVAAMLVGIAECAISLIVEYAKVRETFGRKIGAYQAVRHACADMELRAEAARSQLWYAAASLKEQRTDASAQLDAAKHLANDAALNNADVNIHLHGGIGVTDEHHAHLLLKRALLLIRLFGCKRTLLPRLLHAVLED
jgi:alkylation response protein AidB-like acyl-CoA dehydrogenase